MGDYDLFRLLVAAGADINQKTSKAGKSLKKFQLSFAFAAKFFLIRACVPLMSPCWRIRIAPMLISSTS